MFSKNDSRILPAGPLMKEHRVIEKVIALLSEEITIIKGKISPVFFEKVIDFFRFYADRCHHGKEEDILFFELDKKPMSPEHRKIMKGLLSDHIKARKLVASLDSSVNRYKQASIGAVSEVKDVLKEIVNLYTAHIKKEDKGFFFPVMKYFNRQEKDDLIARFVKFDSGLVHEKYKKIIEDLQKNKKGG